MHIFWYYPFPHAAESALALACLREGDRLTVQALQTFEGRLLPGDFSSYDVRRELPEPHAGRSRVKRVSRRLRDPVARVLARNRAIRATRPDICHLHSVNLLVDSFDVGRLGPSCATRDDGERRAASSPSGSPLRGDGTPSNAV